VLTLCRPSVRSVSRWTLNRVVMRTNQMACSGSERSDTPQYAPQPQPAVICEKDAYSTHVRHEPETAR